MKKILTIVLLSMILPVTAMPCVNAEPIEVEYADTSMGLSLYPFMENGTLMVPLREMAENLNFMVEWDSTDSSANLLKVNSEAKIYAGTNRRPAIANEFVVIIKESSICYTIGVQDLMFAVDAIRGANYIIMEPLLVATAIYFCLCFPTSKIIAYFERKMSRGDKR